MQHSVIVSSERGVRGPRHRIAALLGSLISCHQSEGLVRISVFPLQSDIRILLDNHLPLGQPIVSVFLGDLGVAH
jgi:hypothetical protein